MLMPKACCIYWRAGCFVRPSGSCTSIPGSNRNSSGSGADRNIFVDIALCFLSAVAFADDDDAQCVGPRVVLSHDAGLLRFHGLHRGPFLGFAPTGVRVWWDGVAVFTFDGGKVRDLWVLEDIHRLTQRLKNDAHDGLEFTGPGGCHSA